MGRIFLKGFTLIELLVVVTIIGILLVILLPNYTMLGTTTRLQNMTDRVMQMIDQAKTFSVSGYKIKANDPTLSVMGVEMHQGSNTVLLFACPLVRHAEIPCDMAAKEDIQRENLGDTILRTLTNPQQPPISYTTATILFSPPFGNGVVLVHGHVEKMTLAIELGMGNISTILTKKLEYISATNRVNYE